MNRDRKLTAKKDILALIMLCMMAYFISYITRINYAAVLVEIIRTEGYTKVAASAALTGLFITYGCGQIISGRLGDRFRAERLPFWGLLLAAAMNFFMPLVHSAAAMTAIWCVNGFAQALMWPPIVKILLQYLTAKDYKKYVIYVGWGGMLGTVAIYLLVPLLITVADWRAVFYMCGAAGALMAVLWATQIGRIERRAAVTEDTPAAGGQPLPDALPLSRGAVGLIVLIMLILVMQGVLRDGISTWMPTYISEAFHMGSAAAVLTGVGLPLFSMVVSMGASYMNRRLIKNEGTCCAVFFAVCFVCNLVLCLLPQSSAAPAVMLLTVINAATHGINLMLTCMIIPAFSRFGRVSFLSGLFNSATYIGSAVSMYGIAGITDSCGWSGTLLFWCLIAAAGLAFSAVAIRMIAGFKRSVA